jgi:hypothetical protein
MSTSKKLKPRPWAIIIPIVFGALVLSTYFTLGREIYWTVIAIVVSLAAIVHFIVLLRTKNWGHLAMMLFYAFLVLASIGRDKSVLEPIGVVGAGVSSIFMFYAFITKKVYWRYSEILELAAKPVKKVEDGFTSRPFPAGEAQYTKEEIEGFATFMLQHVIAATYYEDDRIVLVIPKNMYLHLLYLQRNYRKDTYVSFGYDGNISVHIAKKDYSQYKDELTFDQLCLSLGNVFKEFLHLYQMGEGTKIIEKLNAVSKEK